MEPLTSEQEADYFEQFVERTWEAADRLGIPKLSRNYLYDRWESMKEKQGDCFTESFIQEWIGKQG